MGTGGTGVTVGVADTGIAYDHPDLAANIWANPGESGGGKESNGTDDDGNGRVDDVHGYDFVAGDSDPRDDQDHGSHVAGTIGADGQQRRRSGRRQLAGEDRVAAHLQPQSPGRLLARRPGGRIRLRGTRWDSRSSAPASAGASSGRPSRTRSPGASNTLFVFAAGNEAGNNDQASRYPCQYSAPNILCVGASDQADQLAWFSNYGSTSVDLVAPGTNILSTIPFATRFEDVFEVNDFTTRWATGGTNNTWGGVCGVANCVMADSPPATTATTPTRGPDREPHQPFGDGGLPAAVPDVHRHETRRTCCTWRPPRTGRAGARLLPGPH